MAGCLHDVQVRLEIIQLTVCQSVSGFLSFLFHPEFFFFFYDLFTDLKIILTRQGGKLHDG